MTVTKAALSRAIGKFRLMAHFPGSDDDALKALGADLVELCGNDSELGALVESITQNCETWPGIFRLHEEASRLRNERASAETTKVRECPTCKNLDGYLIRYYTAEPFTGNHRAEVGRIGSHEAYELGKKVRAEAKASGVDRDVYSEAYPCPTCNGGAR